MREQAQAARRAAACWPGPRFSASTPAPAGRISGGARPRKGDIETEVVVICCGVWSPADRARWPGAHDPADADRAPDDQRRPDPAVRRHAGRDRATRSSATWTRTCTSASTAATWRWARTRTARSSSTPDDIPSIEQAVLSPTEMPFTPDDFDPQLEQALELMPDLLGDERVGIRYAINGLDLDDAGRASGAAARRPRSRGLWSVAASWIKEGPGIGRAVAEWMSGRHAGDRHPRGRHRPVLPPSADDRARDRAGARGRSTRCTGSCTRPSSGSPGGRCGCSPVYDRERDLGAVFYRDGGLGAAASGTSPTPALLERYAGRLMEREGEWESRWWSPIINAEHLAHARARRR